MEVIKQGQIPPLPTTPIKTPTQKQEFNFETQKSEISNSVPSASIEMDALYQMFSQLLDRKVDEIRGAYKNEQTVSMEQNDVDIADDYIEMMRPTHFLSSPDLTIHPSPSRNPTENFHRQQSHPNVSSKIA